MDPKPSVVDDNSADQAEAKNFQDGSTQYDESAAPTPAQNKRLRLKTDLVVLPCAVISMTLAFLDKARAFANTP